MSPHSCDFAAAFVPEVPVPIARLARIGLALVPSPVRSQGSEWKDDFLGDFR